MGASIFGIGVSGLNAAQAGLVTTGHNISNSSTPGFNRQRIEQRAALPQVSGSGFIGQGVEVATVRRAYSEFLDGQMLVAQTQSNYLDAYNAQISQIDNLLADPASGLSPVLQDFFKGVQDVAANPASVPSRQLMLSSGSALISRFQTLNQRFAEIRDGVNSQLASTVNEISSLGSRIANLNQQIVLAQSAGTGQPANDLLDQRDTLVGDLNKLVQATVIKQKDGTYNVFIGNGQNLVIGFQSAALTTTPAADDAQRLEVTYVSGGNNIPLSPSMLQGGSLGGILAFRTTTLDNAQNALGRIAISLAQSFNNQHQLGQDLNGALGGNFFNVPAAGVTPKTSNAGNGVIGVALSNASALTTSDYRLSFSAGTYTLTRISDNVSTLFTTFPQTVDGMTLTLASGAPATGDSFLIQPTRNGARNISLAINDTAKIAAAAPIRIQAAQANSGNGKISAGSVNTFGSVTGSAAPVTLTITAAAGNNTLKINVDGVAATVIIPDGAPYASNAALATQLQTSINANATLVAAGKSVTVTQSNGRLTVASNSSGAASSVAIGGTGDTATANLFTVATPTAANLQQPVTITFTSATTFNVTGTGTGNPVGVAYTAGSAISYNGWTLNITGAPANGDVFTVTPNTNGVADNRNALLLAGLQTQNTMVGNTVSYQGGYSQLVSEVGNKAREMQVTSKAQANLLADAAKSRESFSGINLDEEAANLIHYQQAYQASGKVIQVASILFDTLLGLGK